jgi:hypothetical protein
MAEEFANRIGHDNFVWWIGVIEDRKDPLNLGRCKIRIFGSHTENLQLIPTSSLPWAMPMYPVNDPRTFSAPMEGEYVFGFFTDGLSSQAPVYMGVFPGIPQSEPKPGVGFSALAAQTTTISSTSTTGDEALQAFEDAQQAQLAAQEGSAFASSTEVNPTDRRLAAGTQTTPMPPTNASAMQVSRVGKPTIPTNAYSTNNTIIQVTNNNTVHACDFRFLINFADLNIGVIENPIKLIEEAIKNAQNKAAAIIRAILQQVIDKFRTVLKAITVTLNLDPTGQIAKAISRVREVIRTINYYSRKLAEYIGNAALIVALISEIKQVVEWIKSLPANILAMLKDCLTSFQGAIQSAGSQIALIPGQISSSVEGAFKDLENSTGSAISQSEQAAQTANVPNTLITLITSPDTANVETLSLYITNSFANSNVVISDAATASFNIANTSTP